MTQEAAGGRVFVVGSVNVDLLVRLPRLPRSGETVLGGRITRAHGGKGANQAAAAARLGTPTTLVGAIGPDDDGELSLSALIEAGVDVSRVVRLEEPTGVAVVLVADDGENAIAVASGANARLTGAHVRAALADVPTAHDVVVANLEVGDDAVDAAAAIADASGARFVLNPAPARALGQGLLARCDVLTPNRVEVVELGYAGTAELLATGLGALVVTMGADGAEIHRRGRPPNRQHAFAATVVDTTGAGDAFTAGLASALAGGEALEPAVRRAAAVGALATRALGARAGYPTRDEVEELLRADVGPSAEPPETAAQHQ